MSELKKLDDDTFWRMHEILASQVGQISTSKLEALETKFGGLAARASIAWRCGAPYCGAHVAFAEIERRYVGDCHLRTHARPS
eukprot:9366532-Pyramimonas_sp.AAC.1